jgi:ferredoxin
MNVSIERSGCISCASCWTDCPEIFEEDPGDGLSRIVGKYQVSGDGAQGEIPDNLRKPAQSAAENCPVSVITVHTKAADGGIGTPVCTKPFDAENARSVDADNPCDNGER